MENIPLSSYIVMRISRNYIHWCVLFTSQQNLLFLNFFFL